MSMRKGFKLRFGPRSLLGQMLLAVAVALLVAQGISAGLVWRAQQQRRESALIGSLAFQLVAEPRFDYREGSRGDRPWRRLRIEHASKPPLMAGEKRDADREEELRAMLTEQGIRIAQLVVFQRPVAQDRYVTEQLAHRPRMKGREDWRQGKLQIAGLRREGEQGWIVARVPERAREDANFGLVVAQTLLLYLILVGGLAVLLRRITRPLAALTRRLETFAETRAIDGQLEPSGPEDTRRLIAAHNAMEARIAALLNEKDVMLGAIGHDLKTPLTALRVRAEKFPNEDDRAKMAATIEDISRSLDDILSLARVGRPSDPLERIELSAALAQLAEEYEDMGEEVVLGETQRIVAPARATWLRRALRNLIGNALRYGGKAEVSLALEGGEAVLRIVDEGPGIPEHDIERMLEPFTRGDPSRNRATGGAGLGLTLARAIAEQHGGSLRLYNRTDGAGLVAEMRLPTGG
ncbi:MAG TPA: ATP-binding protein [Croceibacterium sp.]|nr:ATP-binding protein [Croceibacterium sp.]